MKLMNNVSENLAYYCITILTTLSQDCYTIDYVNKKGDTKHERSSKN